MDYNCPVCKATMPRNLMVVISHTEIHIVNEIKKTHPTWTEKDGVCKKCYDYYKNQMHPK